MTTIELWAHQWGVPPHALTDLRQRLVNDSLPATMAPGTQEGVVVKAVRLEAAQKGDVLWRNHRGMAFDDSGNPIRYGLANDSVQMNKVTKSSDLIGIHRLPITQDMVGSVVGQFMAREIKRAGWVYKGTPREKAQAHYLELVAAMGGNAGFASGLGTI